MYAYVLAGLLLLAGIGPFTKPKPVTHTNASVKLWLDTTAGNNCEHSVPASGAWMIRNNEDRNVLVTVHRSTTKAGATKEDDVHDTLGPRESRELGCEITGEAHQSLTVVRAIF
jgi:hypothetical protein